MGLMLLLMMLLLVVLAAAGPAAAAAAAAVAALSSSSNGCVAGRRWTPEGATDNRGRRREEGLDDGCLQRRACRVGDSIDRMDSVSGLIDQMEVNESMESSPSIVGERWIYIRIIWFRFKVS
jgi:hypothetical protein